MAPVAAIFDLDNTLLAGSSGALIVSYLRRTRQLRKFFRPRHLITMADAVIRYRLGRADTTETMQRVVRCARGLELDEVWAIVDAWYTSMLSHAIRPLAVKRLAWHLDHGHTPVICSASSQFSVVPVARELGIQHTLFTEWLAEGETLSGEIRLPINYGHGKLFHTSRWADDQCVDLSQSYFYTDHISDLPLLEQVGTPVAVSPEPRLRKEAARRGWMIETW